MTLSNGRRPERPEPRHRWLLPLVVGLAVAVLVFVVVVASRDGVGGTARVRVDEQRAELVRRVSALRSRADAVAERRAAASGGASA